MRFLQLAPGIAALILGAALGCSPDRGPAGFPPALPPPGAEIDPLLLAKIDAQIAAVEKAPADAQAHGLLAIIYEANEFWASAQAAYEIAARLDPSSPEWLYHAAICQAETTDLTGAERKLAELTARFPGFAPARHFFGLALLESGDLAGAERELLAARDAARTHPEAQAAVAELRITEGRYAEGLEHAERAIAIAPDYRRARYLRGVALRGLGRTVEAAADLAAGAEADQRWLPDRLSGELPRHRIGLGLQIGQGADLVEAGRFDEAITLLLRALADRPDDPGLLNNLSVAYQRKGDFQASYDALIGLYRKDREHLPTLMNLAETLWALKRHEEGLTVAKEAVRMHPRSSHAHFAHGKALYALDRIPEGVAACETAITFDTLNFEFYAAAGEGRMRLGELDRAEPHLRRAVELQPNGLPARANLCALLIRRGQLGEAETQLRELTSRAPDHPQVRILQERFAEARRTPAPGKPAG